MREDSNNQEGTRTENLAMLIPGIKYCCEGRSFYLTEEGGPGLAPFDAKMGDLVTVLKGCSSPMILRPTESGQYKVVGETYCDGFMNGEAFSGPLPCSFKEVKRLISVRLGYEWAYLNESTRAIQVDDPRLGLMPPGWRIISHDEEEYWQAFMDEEAGKTTFDGPRLTSEALRERGVPLQVFELV